LSSLINNNGAPNVSEFEGALPNTDGITSPNINMKPSRLNNRIGKVKPTAVLSGDGSNILKKEDESSNGNLG